MKRVGGYISTVLIREETAYDSTNEYGNQANGKRIIAEVKGQVKGTLTYLKNGRVRVVFKEPQKSVTPGQSVVFYNEDIVLAGATIDEPIP